MAEDIIAQLLARNAQQAAITAQNSATAKAAEAAGSASAAAGSASAASGSAGAAAGSASAASGSATAAAGSASDANTSAGTASTQATLATAQATAAGVSASAAAASSASVGFLNAVVSTGGTPPYTVTGITAGSAGSGATVSGEFDLVISGGPAGHQAKVIVSAGAITGYRILNGGLSTSNTAPTYTLPTIAGLTGATAPTATVAALANGQRFRALSSDLKYEITWQVSGGVLAPVTDSSSTQISRPLSGIFQAISRLLTWGGSTTRSPFWVDASGNELLGADGAPSDGSSRYRGDFIDWLRALPFTVSQLASFSGLNRLINYSGSATRMPIAVDAVGNLLIGVNAAPSDGIGYAEGMIVDNILSRAGSSSISGNAAIPLAAANKIALNTSTTWYGYYSGGQSLSVGRQGLPLISTSQPYSNKMLTGGVKGTGTGLVALVEDTNQEGGAASTTTGETVCSGAANNAAKYYTLATGNDPNSIIFIAGAPGQGGTAIAGLSKGTTSYNRMLSQVTNAKAAATAAGKSYVVAAVSWIQGETDLDNSTTRAAYLAACLQLVADFNTDIKAITGQTSPVHMLMCQCAKGTQANPNVALAQFDAVNSSDLIHFVTGYGFIPFGADNLHSTPVGYRWLGTYIGRALKQLLVDGNVPDCIWPLSATATTGATTIKIKYRTPTKLVLNGPVQTNYGFKVVDDSGTLTLSNIRVVNGTEVWIDLNRALAPNWFVRYALDYQVASVPAQGGAGDLTDSTTETCVIQGNTYSLVYRAPAMSLPGYFLEA